jgi:predicted GH43/DUF377 family glycosyl hydrolase
LLFYHGVTQNLNHFRNFPLLLQTEVTTTQLTNSPEAAFNLKEISSWWGSVKLGAGVN